MMAPPPLDTTDYGATLRAALDELRQRRAEIEALRRARDEPIAVVGMACRLPGGVETPGAFWDLLDAGVDATGEVPADRWDADSYYDPDPSSPGKMATRRGGFLRDVDRFDPQFFGISPREAVGIDPQQRLVLEVAWEALENAMIPVDSLYQSPTGVFLGITCFDHALRMASAAGGTPAYAGTGGALNMAAGRLSYSLGLIGPSLAVDTACSSSLVAIHLACQSLRARESDLALAGGVHLILSPEVMVGFSQARMLSPDGRCKTFDASADGYSRGEGCGIVVLKRLSDAKAQGDAILGLIRGSAVNQDGPSGGLTVPSAASQRRAIRLALERAGVAPAEVGYVEAHGTGTPLGDPIEMEALGAYGDGRSADDPLIVGSVKTNIGHLEPASGVVGLIKVLLAFRHGTIPRHLHFRDPSPHIPWAELPIRIASGPIAWPAGGRGRLAGVGASGFSGTNAHLIVEEPPAADAKAPPARRPAHLLPLSARSDDALVELARRYHDLLSGDQADLAETCRAAAIGRAHLPVRLALPATTIDRARRALATFANASLPEGASRGHSRSGRPPKVAFLFPGRGAIDAGVALELYDAEPGFREAIDRCDQALEGRMARRLTEAIFAPSAGPTTEAEPALFALEYALANLWGSWGVRPWGMLGQGVGEFVAACVAGAMSIEDGLRLVTARARLSRSPSGGETAEPAMVGAAIASGRGPRPAADRGNGVHSPGETPALDEFREAIRAARLSRPDCPLMSSRTGAPVEEEWGDPDYWMRPSTAPLDAAAGLAALDARGADLFLEVGPEPILSSIGTGCLGGAPGRWLPSLRPDRPAWASLLESLGALYAGGGEVDWAAFHPGASRPPVTLPNYPFQRRRYWLETTPARAAQGRGSPADVDQGKGAPPPERLYRVEWEARPDATQGPLAFPNGDAWLVLADRGGLGRAIADRLRGHGQRCLTARVGGGFRRLGEGDWGLDPDEPGDFRRLFVEARERGGPPVGRVLFLWGLDATTEGLDDGPGRGSQDEGCVALLHLVHALAAESGRRPRLGIVTRDAVEAGAAPAVGSPAQAPLWGFGRGVSLEHPELSCGCIDLDPVPSDGDAEAVLREILDAGPDDQVAFRAGIRHVPRLIANGPVPAAGLRASTGGTYLITGGFGALGLAVARSLSEAGARRLVLLGRSGAATGTARDAVSELRASGVEVRCESVDVADRGAMGALFASLRAGGVTLRGVVHAAGLPGNRPVDALDAEAVRAVLRPKVQGAWLLHHLSLGEPLDFFAMFSSISSVWGSRSQAHYGAANRFLDALAHHRRALGLPALSVNWGPWAGGGMASSEADALLRRIGVNPIPAASAIESLAGLINAGATQMTVADIDWARFKGSYEARGERPFLGRISAASPGTAPTPTRPGLADDLLAAAPGDRGRILLRLVRGEVAQVLALGETWLDPEQGFFELGMDSILALEFRGRLEAALGRALPVTLVFDHPTIQSLGDFLLEQLAPGRSPGVEASPPTDDGDLVALVDSLERLSDAEAEVLLMKRLATPGGP